MESEEEDANHINYNKINNISSYASPYSFK